jgi:hypothetical protein
VVVNLAELTATFLATDGEPDVDPAALLPDLRIHVRGTLSGPPTAPAIAATVIRVRPGELRGTVVSIDGATHTVVVDIARVDDPFGGAPLADPATLVLATVARFDGEARSEAALIDLFLGLAPGERLALPRRGLGNGAGGGKLFDIKSQVEH